MATKFNLKSYIISALRRASYRNRSRTEAMNKAKMARNTYKCATCKKFFSHKEVALDHIEPVVPLTGWESWDSFINRLFCEISGLQVLCKPHHKEKTLEENRIRREHAKRQKI